MNEQERGAYASRICPECSGRIRVTWDTQASLAESSTISGRDLVPISVRCADRTCPLNEPENWALGQEPVESS